VCARSALNDNGEGYGRETEGRPRYTPEEIARHYGLGDDDYEKVTSIMKEVCQLTNQKHNRSVSTNTSTVCW